MLELPADLEVRRGPPTPGGAQRVEIDFTLDPALRYFPDHFPRFPMLAGVVQLGWAVHLARRHLGVAGAVRAITQLKFQSPLLPGWRVRLELEREDASAVRFAYRAPHSACSSGRLEFAPA